MLCPFMIIDIGICCTISCDLNAGILLILFQCDYGKLVEIGGERFIVPLLFFCRVKLFK